MRFLAAILASAFAAYALGFYLAVLANPEVKFWREVVERRDREIASVRKNQPGTPIIFFSGGSSTAFSIDPRIVEDTCGIPTFNLGLPAASGGQYLLHHALSKCKSGDILIVCLETDMLAYSPVDSSSSPFSYAIAASTGRLSEAGGGETFGDSVTLGEHLNLSRPGPRYLATLGAKALAGRGYRYTPEDLRYRGRLETSVQNPSLVPSGPMPSTRLSRQGLTLLKTFQKAADAAHVRTFYSMPWHLTAESDISENRRCKNLLLQDISNIMPVLHDEFTGSVSKKECFSDTSMHLSASGSEARSASVAAALQKALANPP